jgi:hypothetical protein
MYVGLSTPGPNSPPFSPPSSPGGGSPKSFFSEDTSGLLDKKNQAPLPVKDPKIVHSELRDTVSLSKSIQDRQGMYRYDLFCFILI